MSNSTRRAANRNTANNFNTNNWNPGAAFDADYINPSPEFIIPQRNTNNAFGMPGKSLNTTYTNVTLPGRPTTSLINKNLSSRSHYVEGNVTPSPYIRIHPDRPSPFSAQLQINKAHKGTVYGNKPENLLNRYKYQKDFFAKELQGKQYNLRQINLEQAKENARLQQEINSANSLRKIQEREMDEAIQRAKNSAEASLSAKMAAEAELQQEINSANSLRKIQEREMDEAIQRAKNSAAASLSAKMAAEARRKTMANNKMTRGAKLFPKPSTPRPISAPAPVAAPAKKSFWQRMTGRGRKTRKNRRN